MLMLLGFLMIATFIALIMTRTVSALVALILVPLAYGLLAGHGSDLGGMVVGGISKLAPIATMLLFAILYFGIMIDAGLFDPLVGRILRFAGNDPVRVAVGTAVLALTVSLDGDGSTTALICVTAMLPVYQRLGMNPLVLAVILGAAGTVMNLTPWGGPVSRVAAALHLDIATVFVPLIPTILAGIVATLAIAWHLGRRERTRLAGAVIAREDAGAPFMVDRDQSLLRPRLLSANLFLTLAVLGTAIAGLLPLPMTFMIGLSLAMLLNYPQVAAQRDRLRAHADNALPVVLLILAAGAFTGIITGTGMIDAMARGAMTLVPRNYGAHLGIVMAFLAMPLTFALSTDAYYFGVVPVVAQTAALHHVDPAIIARASLLAMPFHALSPLTAALYLVAGLVGREVGAFQRFALLMMTVLTLVMIAAAIVTGVIV